MVSVSAHLTRTLAREDAAEARVLVRTLEFRAHMTHRKEAARVTVSQPQCQRDSHVHSWEEQDDADISVVMNSLRPISKIEDLIQRQFNLFILV